MNLYSENVLKSISDLARLFFTRSEIAQMLDLDIEAFCKHSVDINHPVFKAICSKFEEEIKLRQSIFKTANSGSVPAQTMCLDIIKNYRLKELNND
jgi:hypothetical protein